MIKPMCEQMHIMEKQGQPVKHLQQDNTGETRSYRRGRNPRTGISVKPLIIWQQGCRSRTRTEMAFPMIVAQARVLMNHVQVPLRMRYKLFTEATCTSTKLDCMTPISLKRVKKPRIKHFSMDLSAFSRIYVPGVNQVQ